MRLRFEIRFIGRGLCYEQAFFVRADSLEGAITHFRSTNPTAHVTAAAEVRGKDPFDRVYAEAPVSNPGETVPINVVDETLRALGFDEQGRDVDGPTSC